ncbi:MAG: type II toxin-antitoxin system RelE/ParE family toxin [Flavobacteriales bacterium]|nr:type II toxin-antitoxin system RelE/ParE family toxin [Flavobacteriales bacterium]MCL4280698.1 type II toxin-antitoxin system RelE/ParE family toxin [Flavobacteriales bacterium]
MTKRYEVVVRHQVQREVEEIYDHQYGIDPARAERFHAAWQDCLEQLGKNPSHSKRKGPYGHELLYNCRSVLCSRCGRPR